MIKGFEEMKKKLISILLSAAIIIGVLPLGLITTSAEETDNLSVSSADISLSGTNSVGNMLAAELEEAAAQTEGSGNVIYSVEIDEFDKNTAYIELSTAVSCTLFVGIYTEDKLTLLSSGSVEVTPEEEYTEITLSGGVPEYFYIKAFLVDAEDYSPLSAVYNSPMYTKEMQEFLSKTTADFAEDKVVNFDEDTTNNFAVLSDSVLTLGENSETNKITFANTASDTYIIENIDDSVRSLKAGDTFSGVFNGENIIVKIGEIAIEGTTATILGADAELDEVFDYVKLDQAAGISDGSVDETTCGEGVTFEGYENDITTYGADIGGSVGANAKFSFQFVKLGNDNANVKVSGNIKVKFVFSPKLYISASYKYIDLKFDYNVSGSVSVTGEVAFDKPLAVFTFGIPGVRAEVITCFTLSASGGIEISGTLFKGTLGYGWYSDVGGVNLCSVPKAEAEIKAEVTVFIGFKIEPKIKIAEGVLAETSIESNVGAELTAELSGNTSELTSSSQKHDCNHCVEGEIYGKFDISVKGKLLKNKKWSLDFNIVEVKVKLSDFYWSLTHGEFGFTTCPYITNKLIISVTDYNGKPIKNSVVTVENTSYNTNGFGIATLYLKDGIHNVKASADGYADAKKTVVIDGKKKAIKIKLKKAVIVDIETVSLGYNHSAAITKSGDLYMWGDNNCGKLGDGTTTDRTTPKLIMSDVASVSLGYDHSAAITKSGDLYMWGRNSWGQLGDGTNTDYTTPQYIMSDVVMVSLGCDHSAAITKNGDLYTWGADYYGQLGDGMYGERNKPNKIMENVVSVSLGYQHSAAITKNGDLYMWGVNDNGQLGNGSKNQSNTPIKIMENVVSVSLGYQHSAAITEDGDLYMWGYNEYGQAADNVYWYLSTPKLVMSSVASVSLGEYNTAAITKDGDLYMWGLNDSGAFGNGSYGCSYDSPQKLKSNVDSVSLGVGHSAVLTKSGNLYMSGSNFNGELGDGTTTTSYTPVIITIREIVTATVNLYNSANTLNETGAQSSFNGLLPNTIYNFYIMKDRSAENALSSDNLLYINQGITDQNGDITFEYSADGTDFESAEKFVMPIKHFLPDSAIGGTVITSATDKVTLNVLNTDLSGYNNIFARFTVGEESYDIAEYTTLQNGLQFICNVGGGLPENSIISVQLFASYQGVQYRSDISYTLLIDARCDLDGDGGVGALDTALLKQTLLGAASVAQDVNGDGKADILDLVHLKKYLAEIV